MAPYAMTMERIGLFGGSFDPVHLGHLLVARAAVEEVGLHRIFFIPAAQSPFKPDREPAPGPLRMRLLRLALAGMTDCEVDGQELARGGVSYTIDTVRRYAANYPQAVLHYVVGADHVASLPQWRDAEALARCARFIVVPRPRTGDIRLPSPFQGVPLRGFPLAVSSSEIRERVRAGLPIELFTGAAVAEAIQKNRLYL
jgi:nicotinate-nucleotide adenylyltransferase